MSPEGAVLVRWHLVVAKRGGGAVLLLLGLLRALCSMWMLSVFGCSLLFLERDLARSSSCSVLSMRAACRLCCELWRLLLVSGRLASPSAAVVQVCLGALSPGGRAVSSGCGTVRRFFRTKSLSGCSSVSWCTFFGRLLVLLLLLSTMLARALLELEGPLQVEGLLSSTLHFLARGDSVFWSL